MKVTVMPAVISLQDIIAKGLVKGLKDLQIRRDNRNYSIIKMRQNTEKKTKNGDLRRVAFTQTPVKNYRLTLAFPLFVPER